MGVIKFSLWFIASKWYLDAEIDSLIIIGPCTGWNWILLLFEFSLSSLVSLYLIIKL